ncbi:MAG: MBL fold metallo-hydrolase, partial [Clostridia bacterium]|nr:MBL fold metallo-hydrolase [Clostridia bacterium]
ALVDKEITPLEPKHGDIFEFGDAEIEILSGLSDHNSTNEQSIVCRITFGNNRFLMMGDAGKEVEEELLEAKVDLSADVLKVGHHGSRYSSTKAFMYAVSPSYAVIPCGLGNSYNHPHEETLEVLKRVNAQVYRSDLDGDVTMVSDGKTITITTEK